jgi:hypothetical protein
LEVLARPAAESWAQGARHNPWLAAWRERAATGGLRPSDWPAGATRRLDGAAYARRFRRLLRVPPSAVPAPEAGVQAMDQFIRDKLTGDNQYPLLWSVRP